MFEFIKIMKYNFFSQLSCELKHLLSQIDVLDKFPKEEISIIEGCIKKYDAEPEKMLPEDVCALEKLTEERMTDLLKQRLERGDSYSFAGDVLISLNSNELPTQFSRTVSSFIFLCMFVTNSFLFIIYGSIHFISIRSFRKCDFSIYKIYMFEHFCSSTAVIIANLVLIMHRIYSL